MSPDQSLWLAALCSSVKNSMYTWEQLPWKISALLVRSEPGGGARRRRWHKKVNTVNSIRYFSAQQSIWFGTTLPSCSSQFFCTQVFSKSRPGGTFLNQVGTSIDCWHNPPSLELLCLPEVGWDKSPMSPNIPTGLKATIHLGLTDVEGWRVSHVLEN